METPKAEAPIVANPSLPPADAWQRLPEKEWNETAARHLLRRVGWAAQPEEVQRALNDGLNKTLERLFPPEPKSIAKPKLLADVEDETPKLVKKIEGLSGDDKRMYEREVRERNRMALQDLSIKWLQWASRPEHAAFEKWVLFLSDIYVVGFEKVHQAGLIWQHYDMLRQCAYSRAPVLSKSVSRSPAMIVYLDLQQSRREAPNENFARELFELFVLGVGNYTEQDIKEAARAFTGYRQRLGEFVFVPREHDERPKTVFGHIGNFDGDDVIDLAYELPAAARFLPHEMVKWYLSDTPIGDGYLDVIGRWWREQKFDLRKLALQFFSSRLFFAPEFRGNFIKSPLQFYLGMIQDLNLDVAPLPRQVLVGLRQMGQILFDPPNVRGWVGGRYWINSATLSARRALVAQLFSPLNEAALNADEQVEIAAAHGNGADRFALDDAQLRLWSQFDAEQLAARFCDYFLPVTVGADFREQIKTFLGAGGESHHRERIRDAAMAVLESPEYQLC